MEYYTTQNSLEYHQDTNCARVINRRRSVSVIFYTFIDVDVCWKVQIQPYVASESTNGDIL